jgi:hypothetical protein
LHFLPQFGKPIDPEFKSAQPLAYLPFNLLIADEAFYQTDALQKQPHAVLYTNYVGWLPVVLAVVGLATARGEGQRRVVWFLAAVILVAR